MVTIKKILWQLCGVLITLLNLARLLACAYFAVKIIGETISIVRIGFWGDGFISIEWTRWAIFVCMIFGTSILWFLGCSLHNLKERAKDNALRCTIRYYSYETICQFQKDYASGDLSGYSDIDVYFLKKELLKKDDEPFQKTEEKRKPYKKKDDPIPLDEDSQRILSQAEINGFTKKGAAHPQEELDKLIGLAPVKEKITELRNRFKYEKMRKSNKKLSVCNHLCFIGPPGTGKTTVARIMSGFLYELKIIKKNQVVEISGNDLMGQYLGYTAKRTKRIIEAAKGGVLFIDEAYALVAGAKSGSGNFYGEEALAELVKAMEDLKDELVIIFAGYPREMDDFLNINTGMKSRIKDFIVFPNYSSPEMGEILVRMAEAQDYTVSEELKEEFINYSAVMLLPRNDFANARDVRQSLDAIINRHAKNIVSGATDSSEINYLSIKDFPWFKNNP